MEDNYNAACECIYEEDCPDDYNPNGDCSKTYTCEFDALLCPPSKHNKNNCLSQDAGVEEAYEMLKDSSGFKMMILVTDGQPTEV